MIKIRLKTEDYGRGDIGFVAILEDNQTVGGRGGTRAEAIGDLVCRHPEVFNVQVEDDTASGIRG